MHRSTQTPRALRAARRDRTRAKDDVADAAAAAVAASQQQAVLPATSPTPTTTSPPAGYTTAVINQNSPAGITVTAGQIPPTTSTTPAGAPRSVGHTTSMRSSPLTGTAPVVGRLRSASASPLLDPSIAARDPTPPENPTSAAASIPTEPTPAPAGKQPALPQMFSPTVAPRYPIAQFPVRGRVFSRRTPPRVTRRESSDSDDSFKQLLNHRPEGSVPPPGTVDPAGNDTHIFFQRRTLATTSFALPWPFCELFALETLVLEYKRLAPPREMRMPFDVYTVQLCGVSNTHVAPDIQRFAPPHSILHRSTNVRHDLDVLEGYQSIRGLAYFTRNLPEAHRGIIDDKIEGEFRLYNISEFSFLLDNTKRAWMDSLLPAVLALWHILLTYMRYLAVVSDFLPIFGKFSFTTRMLVRLSVGIFSTYVHSEPAILGQAIFGMTLQWLFYRTQSHIEIRDMFKVIPFRGWLLVHTIFYFGARFLSGVVADLRMEDWSLKISHDTLWDILGLNLSPLPIAIKLGAGSIACCYVTERFHLLRELYTQLLQTSEHTENQLDAANAILSQIGNAAAIARSSSSEL